MSSGVVQDGKVNAQDPRQVREMRRSLLQKGARSQKDLPGLQEPIFVTTWYCLTCSLQLDGRTAKGHTTVNRHHDVRWLTIAAERPVSLVNGRIEAVK